MFLLGLILGAAVASGDGKPVTMPPGFGSIPAVCAYAFETRGADAYNYCREPSLAVELGHYDNGNRRLSRLELERGMLSALLAQAKAKQP